MLKISKVKSHKTLIVIIILVMALIYDEKRKTAKKVFLLISNSRDNSNTFKLAVFLHPFIGATYTHSGWFQFQNSRLNRSKVLD